MQPWLNGTLVFSLDLLLSYRNHIASSKSWLGGCAQGILTSLCMN